MGKFNVLVCVGVCVCVCVSATPTGLWLIGKAGGGTSEAGTNSGRRVLSWWAELVEGVSAVGCGETLLLCRRNAQRDTTVQRNTGTHGIDHKVLMLHSSELFKVMDKVKKRGISF